MDVTRLPNRDLIAHLVDAREDHPVWPEFVGRFRERLRQVVYRTVVTETERNAGLELSAPVDSVEDLTQEVFLKLIEGDRRALSRFRGRSEQSIYTYLSAIAVNLVRDHFKKLRALKKPRAMASLSNVVSSEETGSEGPSYDQALVSEGPGPERYVRSQELRQRMLRAIDEISGNEDTSARDRLVFKLYFLEGLTVDEIARARSIRLSASGVEKRVRRIREAIKERLSDPGR